MSSVPFHTLFIVIHTLLLTTQKSNLSKNVDVVWNSSTDYVELNLYV